MSTGEIQTISELLLREMDARNWSQREMAKACALSNTTISKIVRGQSLPDPNTCFMLAQGLDLPAQYILSLAGHKIADAQLAAPSLEAFLHALYTHLPDRAIQEMLGAIRTIERAYTTPSSTDMEEAQRKLVNAEFIRRWLDPIKRKTLTVVQGGHFLFYQTADLDLDGKEIAHSELLPIQGDLSSLSMFPVYNFANSFCVQLYPLAEFDTQRCQSHRQHAILFTPIHAGDRGSGVKIVYPDGLQELVRDQVMEKVWQKIYADASPGNALLLAGPSVQQAKRLAQVRKLWQEGYADELWLNPDARTWAAHFASIEGDTNYYLLTGALDEIDTDHRQGQSTERIEMVDTTLYGRFETSVIHLQGFCIKLHPDVEYITATRRIIPAHRTLIWNDRETKHILTINEYLGTWLSIQVNKDDLGKTQIHIVEDMPLRAEAARRRMEKQIQELENLHIAFTDSHSPY